MNMIANDNRLRRQEIMLRLLDYETLSYQKLSDQYFVSRSSLSNDFNLIKHLFQKDGASLSFNNSGTFFSGSEIQAQQILKRLMISQDQPFYLDGFDSALYNRVICLLQEYSDSLQQPIPGDNMAQISTSICLLIGRAKAGHRIQLLDTNYLEPTRYYPRLWELISRLESACDLAFSASELGYLVTILLGSGFSQEEGQVQENLKDQIRALIQDVSLIINLDLQDDHKLLEDIAIHMKQLFTRLQANNSLVNPLLADIKSNYHALFQDVKFLLTNEGSRYGLPAACPLISDDEIGFLVLHIQAAIERKFIQKKVVIVSPNGIGVSTYINAKIQRFLPNLHDIQIVSLKQLEKLEVEDISFIISTVPIENLKRPVITISPLCTEEDMRQIMTAYAEVVARQSTLNQYQMMNHGRGLIDAIYKGNFKSQEEALSFLLDQQPDMNQAKKAQVLASILEREAQQSTYLDKGIAIPHANPQLVETSNISVLLLDKAIAWGYDKVDVVVLLLVAKEETSKVGDVMYFIVEGVRNKAWLLKQLENDYGMCE
ncbi:PRD domain-containing protein [Abiotrophia defectiva]|uniref:BglG family transcription antiterminator n=1 Tax=Abiotrophia defectiva TaxID=46125 RepID=UPI0028E55C35|nr:PRD domain-containing protein [Abiotrophia defectiva]